MLNILKNENESEYKEVTLCAVKELPYFCIGCCAFGYKPKKELMKEDILENTKEHTLFENLEEFRDRTNKTLKPSGSCPCLIEKNNNAVCGIHPKLIHSKLDLRKNFCNISYECATAKAFSKMDSDKKKKFITFVLNKKLNQYSYSLQIFNGSLFKEFES